MKGECQLSGILGNVESSLSLTLSFRSGARLVTMLPTSRSFVMHSSHESLPPRPPDPRANTLCTCQHTCRLLDPAGQWVHANTAAGHQNRERLMQSNAFRRGRGRNGRGTGLGSTTRGRGGVRGTRSMPPGRGRGANLSVSTINVAIPSKRSHSLSTTSPGDLSRDATVAMVTIPSEDPNEDTRDDHSLGGLGLGALADDVVRRLNL